MDKFSYISNADASFVDDLYKKYISDPGSVDVSWQRFFEGFEFSQENYSSNGNQTASARTDGISLKELGVRNLIHAYRSRGHLKSDTNPPGKKEA